MSLCLLTADDFMNRIEAIASKVPYMHCPGNHEIPYDFIHYRYRFSSPQVQWPIPKYQVSLLTQLLMTFDPLMLTTVPAALNYVNGVL